MNKDIKIALICGGFVAAGLCVYAYSQRKTVELLPESVDTGSAVIVKDTAKSKEYISKVQQYLNNVMPGLTPLEVDGVSGGSTVGRIREFQKLVGRGNPITGTWGTITEGNAMAVFGFTPFQGKQQVLTPVAPKPQGLSTAEVVTFNTKKALLLNGYAHGISSGSAVRIRESASVSAKIVETQTSFIGQVPVGKISDVLWEKSASGNLYIWLRIPKGYVLLSDVYVYSGSDKVLSKRLA